MPLPKQKEEKAAKKIEKFFYFIDIISLKYFLPTNIADNTFSNFISLKKREITN